MYIAISVWWVAWWNLGETDIAGSDLHTFAPTQGDGAHTGIARVTHRGKVHLSGTISNRDILFVCAIILQMTRNASFAGQLWNRKCQQMTSSRVNHAFAYLTRHSSVKTAILLSRRYLIYLWWRSIHFFILSVIVFDRVSCICHREVELTTISCAFWLAKWFQNFNVVCAYQRGSVSVLRPYFQLWK